MVFSTNFIAGVKKCFLIIIVACSIVFSLIKMSDDKKTNLNLSSFCSDDKKVNLNLSSFCKIVFNAVLQISESFASFGTFLPF